MSRKKDVYLYLVNCLQKQEKSSVKFWLGYLIGGLGIFRVTYYYLAFAGINAVQLFEPWILCISFRSSQLFLFLGYLMVLSNVPFTSDVHTQLIYRTNRSMWSRVSCIYILWQTIVYYIVLFAVSCLMSLIHGYSGNIWSKTIYRLATFGSLVAATNYHTSVNEEILHKWLPYSAAFNGLLLIILYSLIIVGIFYCMNILTNRFIGGIVALMVHFVGYMMCSDLHMFGNFGKLSLLANANLEYLFNILYSYALFILIIIVIYAIINKIQKWIQL